MRPIVRLLLVVALGAGVACNRSGPAGLGTGPKPSTGNEPPEFSPVSGKEAESFVRDLASALDPCDSDRLNAFIDLEALGGIVLYGLDAPRREREQFLEEFTGSTEVGAWLCSDSDNVNTDHVTTYHFLRMRGEGKDAGTRPLYRLSHGSGAINYVELQLGRSRGDGKVRIIDAYSFANGDRVSDRYRRIARTVMGAASQGSSSLKPLQEINGLLAAGDNARAHELIGKLPSEVRRTRDVMLTDIKAAAALDDEEYLAAIAAYEEAFPGDPSVDFATLDAHFMREDYDRFVATIDRIDRSVGGDPHLSTMRASVYILSGKLDEALQQALIVMTAEPDDVYSWRVLLSVRLARDEIDEALDIMEQLHERFALFFDPAVMATMPSNARLLASPKWKRWMQAHPEAILRRADSADD